MIRCIGSSGAWGALLIAAAIVALIVCDLGNLLTRLMNQVQSSFQPLVARFPPAYRQQVREVDAAIDDDASPDPGAPGPDRGPRPDRGAGS